MSTHTPVARPRPVRAPRGTQLLTRSWSIEAPLRMLMNNLDPEVAERPDELIVYGGIGKAARNWDYFERIVERDEPPVGRPFRRSIFDHRDTLR